MLYNQDPTPPQEPEKLPVLYSNEPLREGRLPIGSNSKRGKLQNHKIVRILQLVISLTFIIALFAAGFVMYSRYQIDRPGPLETSAVFEVDRGLGLSTIASKLKKDGIIWDDKLFAMNALANKVQNKLKAGRYEIPEKASMQQVLDILVDGKAIYYQVTIPEGFTSEQAVVLLNAHPQLAGTVDPIPPEGSLMPDTYRFSEGTNRNDIVEQMRVARANHLAEKWNKRQAGLPIKTPEEALVLASIVEKETGLPDERPRVASVFINRLRKGMKLQSDPTIIYGLVGGKGKLGHPLRRSELNKKTAYNTYQITGLPPTPIANPGRESIEAVLNPANTSDVYFVADGSGGHAFASTIKEHNENVRNWRVVEAKQREEQKRRDAERLARGEAAKGEDVVSVTSQDMPGVSVDSENSPDNTQAQPEVTQVVAQQAGSKVWGNDIPLPTRKPR